MSSPITQGIFNVRRMENNAKGRKDMGEEGEWKGRNEEKSERRIDEEREREKWKKWKK